MVKIYRPEEPATSQLAGLRQKAAKLEALTTEYNRLEEALRESQEALRRIFESVTDSLPAAEPDGIITEAKPAAATRPPDGGKG
jgi:PAS domain-containing protein